MKDQKEINRNISRSRRDWWASPAGMEQRKKMSGRNRDRIGTSYNVGKKGSEVAMRECLKCGQMFKSDWKGNRICKSCRPWQEETYAPEVEYQLHNRWR